MAQQELDWLKGELQRVEQDIKDRERQLMAATTQRDSAIIQKGIDRLIQQERDLRQQQATLQAQQATPAAGEGVRLNAAVKHFAANIRGIDLSTPSRVVEFGVNMLDGSFRDALYIRSVALPLWKAIEADPKWGVVVSGDPGCGKSHWLLWLLIWLVQHNCKVLWHGRQKSKLTLYFFEASTVRRLSEAQAEEVLVNGGVYYLVDGREPFDFAGMQPIKAVIAHSPKLEAYKDFMKQEYGVHKTPWYMPPLERGEVLEMLPIFPHVPEELALARFDVYGGSARAVFDNASNDQDFKIKTEALAKMTWPTIAIAEGAPLALDEVGSTLITILVPNWQQGEFTTTQVQCASRQMRREIYIKCKEQFRQQLWLWLEANTSTPLKALNSLCGNLFEEFAHDIIPKGGTFFYRELPESQQPRLARRQKLTLDPVEPVRLSSVQDIRLMRKGQYGQLTSATFREVDGVQISPLGDVAYLWQATVSPGAHSLTGYITAILEQLPLGTRLVLMYATPSQTAFDSWTRAPTLPFSEEIAELRRKLDEQQLPRSAEDPRARGVAESIPGSPEWQQQSPVQQLQLSRLEICSLWLSGLSEELVLDSTLPNSHQDEPLDASEGSEASSSDALGASAVDSLYKQPLSPGIGRGRGTGRGQGRSKKPRQSRQAVGGAALPGWTVKLVGSTRLATHGPSITGRHFPLHQPASAVCATTFPILSA